MKSESIDDARQRVWWMSRMQWSGGLDLNLSLALRKLVFENGGKKRRSLGVGNEDYWTR